MPLQPFTKAMTPNQGRQVINSNFEELDSRLNNVEGSSTDVSDVLLDLSNRMDAVEGVNGNQDDALNSLSMSVLELSNKVDLNEAAIGVIEFSVSALELAVSDISVTLGNIPDRLNSAEENIESLQSDMESAEGRLDEVEETLEGLSGSHVSSVQGKSGDVELDFYDIPAPDVEFEGATTTEEIAASSSHDWIIPIPRRRLFGISVSVAGLNIDEEVLVTFYGDDGLSDIQYQANFTYELNEDLGQGWRYRDREEAEGEDPTHVLRVRAENNGASPITITVLMTMEPF